MAESDEAQRSAPYASWATILHLVERMESEGVPSRIDNTYLIGMAGGTQAQVKHALRWLGLIDADGRVEDVLIMLATKPGEREAGFAEIVRSRFGPLVELGENATRGQYDETIRKVFGLNGATARKALAFYLGIASYSGIPLSPYVRPSRPGGTGNGVRRTPRARKRTATPASTPPVAQFPASGHSRSIELESGGTVTVSYSVDLFDLSESDRDFVLRLVDWLRNYAAPVGQSSTAPEAAPGVI